MARRSHNSAARDYELDNSAILAGITIMPADQQRASTYSERHATHFDSLADFIAPRPMRENNLARFKRTASLTYTGQEAINWMGLPSTGAVVDAIRKGWPDGVKRMQDIIGKLNATTTAQSIRRVLVRDDHGDEFDVHRALSGSFDRAWSRRKRGLRMGTKGVTVVLNGGGNCTLNSEQLFWRGAAALCLSDILSDAGYSVKLVVGAAVENADDDGRGAMRQYTVTVKEPHQPMNVEALAAATALPAFWRVGGFKFMCEAPYTIQHSLGHACGLNLDAIPDCENPILVPETVIGLAAAEKWLRAAIKQATGQDPA
jgi:hypothetical protein